MLPILLTDLILNIFSYLNIVDNIYGLNNINNSSSINNTNFYNYNYNDNYNLINYGYGPNNNNNNNIVLSNKETSLKYLKFYCIFTSICIFIQLILLLISLIKNDIWISSKKCINYLLTFNIIWLFLLYLNPLTKYFKFENSNNDIIDDSLYAYSYTYILLNLCKELIPLCVPLFLSLAWSSRHLKIIFPNDIILGWIYQYSIYFFMISSGGILLVLNQYISNYYISVSIALYIISLVIGLIIYKKDIKIFYNDSELEIKELIQYNFNIDFIINISLCIGLILSLIYICTENNIYKSIYSFNNIDNIQFLVKFVFKILFYRILFCDNIISFILYIQKYKILVKTELDHYNANICNIETYLYRGYINRFNIHNGYNSISNEF